jgi:hypothetical protein
MSASSSSIIARKRDLGSAEDIIAKEKKALVNEQREQRLRQIALSNKKKDRTLSLAFGEGLKYFALSVSGAGLKPNPEPQTLNPKP